MGILRFLLAVAVIAAHCGAFGPVAFFGEGVTAVQSFFLLSGFTMALVLRTRYLTDVQAFLINRVVRIYPTYWIVLVGTLAISVIARVVTGHFIGGLGTMLASTQNGGAKLVFLVPNFGIVGIDALLLANLGEICWIPAAWSLAVELFFYALAPFVLRRRPLVIAGAFALAELFRWAFLGRFAEWTMWSYYFMPSELPFFFGGALTYCVYEQVQQNPQMTQLLKRFGPWALGFMCFSIILGRQLGIFRFQSSAYFMFFCVALLPIFEWCRGSRVDYWLGELSFPVYLLHSALLTLWPKARFGGVIPPGAKVYLVTALAIGLSYPTILFERRIRARFKVKPKDSTKLSQIASG